MSNIFTMAAPPGRRLPDPYTGNEEPPLKEVLGDPVVHLVMARAGVCERSLRVIIQDARDRLSRRAASASSASSARTDISDRMSA